jgi:hypothetical protein
VVEAEHLTNLEEIDEAIQRTVNREPFILETLALISRTIDEELQELNLIRSWCLQRRSPPKCLECGSISIHYFQEVEDPITEEEWVEMLHPNCSGRLRSRYVGMALGRGWALPYSAEGDRILK